MIASRTGVRLTPSSRASSASESRWPGVRCNEMIEARRASYASTRVVREGRVRLIGSILLGIVATMLACCCGRQRARLGWTTMIEFADILLEPPPHPFWKTLRQVGIERAVGILPRAHSPWREQTRWRPRDYVALAGSP